MIQTIKQSNNQTASFRLASKKFGHPAAMKRIPTKSTEKFEQKTMKLQPKIGESRKSCRVSVGGVGVDDMIS